MLSNFKNMKLRDWVAVAVGGYVGQKLMVGALKKVLPRDK